MAAPRRNRHAGTEDLSGAIRQHIHGHADRPLPQSPQTVGETGPDAPRRLQSPENVSESPYMSPIPRTAGSLGYPDELGQFGTRY